MHKKLNPGLFDEVSSEKVQSPLGTTSHMMNPMSHQPPPSRLETQKLFEELQLLKGKMRSYENQIEVFKNQMSDFVRSVDQRFERVSQALSRLEKMVHNQGRESDDKLKLFREKIHAQNFEEAKIEGLIERQTVVIRNFENRLTAMQKIINEKELLLMKYVDAFKRSQPAPK